MTEEETRANAYLDQINRRRAFQARMEVQVRGDQSALYGLFLRMKAMIGEVPNNDGQDGQDDGRGRTIANL